MSASYKRITLQLNEQTDADVLEYLASAPNKADAIRQAIRAQLARNEQA